MKSKSLFVLVILAQAFALGCALVDYPVIEDSRGDYEGIIRTGHKAYIQPTFRVATLYPDGSDEIFWMVYQNSYGDQKLYTFNNYDPSGAVSFLDQTYCDWKFEFCEVSRAWNPIQNDDEFDYEFFPDCSGWRSILTIVGLAPFQRVGECGDRVALGGGAQALAGMLANLDETTWRGERAYHLPIDADRFSATLESAGGTVSAMPVFGKYDLVVTDELEYIVPMTPNSRHQLSWVQGWVAEHGHEATMRFSYQGFESTLSLRFVSEGLAHSQGRF
jgi:hypothetical protein